MLFIIVFTLVLAINICLDVPFIKRYWQIPYMGSNVLRAVVFTLNALLAFEFRGDWYVIELIVFQSLGFWLLFDPLLNLARRLPFWHKGEAAGSDALFPDIQTQSVFKLVIIILFVLFMWLTGFSFNLIVTNG